MARNSVPYTIANGSQPDWRVTTAGRQFTGRLLRQGDGPVLQAFNAALLDETRIHLGTGWAAKRLLL